MLMDHGMAQGLDDLFDAMSGTQVAAVQTKIVNSDADDIIGALNAMGVFDLGSPSGQSDPTTTSYMTKFGLLHTANGADQALVLKNADPLDAATMTKVIDAVSSLVDLQGVVDGSATDGALLLAAVGDFATKVDAIDSNATAADALVSVAGYGTAGSASSATANITAQDASGAHALLKAMNPAQLNEVLAHSRTLETTHLANLDGDIAKLMGVQAVAATSSATITGSLAAQGDKFTVTLRDENSNTQDLTYTAVGPVAATSSATITGSLAAQGDKFTVTLRDENSNTQDLTYTGVGPVAATSSATITGSLAAQGDTFEITLTDETNATQVVTMTAGEGGADAAAILTALAGTSSVGGYTFAEVGGALKVTRSDGVDFEISAGAKTGSGDAASDAVARSTNGSTVASENTAADIVTGLAGTSSVGGYTFAEVGGALKVTRSDGVDFEILAGVKTGSGGDAASDAVARSTNGSTVASENTAADIVTGLAANSVGGYTPKLVVH